MKVGSVCLAPSSSKTPASEDPKSYRAAIMALGLGFRVEGGFRLSGLGPKTSQPRTRAFRSWKRLIACPEW